MRRRELLCLIGSVALWPLSVRAQQPSFPVIGFLNSAPPEFSEIRVRAFREGLSETGYAEGQNVQIEFRWAHDQIDEVPTLAADLVKREVNVIVANFPPVQAVKAATATIPVVFVMGSDPVAMGIVPSLNRPGGNTTGVTSLNVELGSKRLELLGEAVHTAKVIAVLLNPTNPSFQPQSRDLRKAAETLGVQLHFLDVSTAPDLDPAIERAVQLRAEAIMFGNDPFFNGRSEQLAQLTLRRGLPAIHPYRPFSAAGGLMSYGGSLTDSYRQAGVYAGMILKGAKPADLPVQQSAKVDLVINLKTANALGLTIPPTLLARADEVIE